jgi:phosphomannomutase
LPKFYQSGEINFSLSSKADQKTIIKKVALHFKSQAKKISRLDGIKLEFNSWWLSLRASQNEPLLRLNLEAKSALILKKQLAIVKKLIKTK